MGGIVNQRFDNQQVRSSYNYKEEMIREGFGGEPYSGNTGADISDLNHNGSTSSHKQYMRRLNNKAAAGVIEDGGDGNQESAREAYENPDESQRVQRGPVTLKNGATYTG